MRAPLLMCLALSIAGAALPSCSASPSPVDVKDDDRPVDLDAIASARAFAEMPAVADEAIAYWTRRYGAPPKAIANQLRVSARKAFAPELFASQLPPLGTADPAASQALARYQAEVARLVASSPRADPTLRGGAEAEDAGASARADRAAIDALADLMPGPERAGERAETLRRMLAALDAVRGGLSNDLRGGDAAKLEDAVESIIANLRRPTLNYADGLPTAGMKIEAARSTARRALSALSPNDITALRAHYGSPAGRSRRQELVAALNVADDKAGQAMLLDFFTAVRRLPPDSVR